MWAALAAYASFGAIAFTGAPSTMLGAGPSTMIVTGSGVRLGLLPLDALHAAAAVLAGLVVLAIGLTRERGGAVALAVSPLILVFLPWLPFPGPAAFLVWTGALASLVWIAVALGLAAAARPSGVGVRGPSTAKRSTLAAGILSVVMFSAAARYASPSLPGGDEPHYLIITQSLLYDGDLKIEDNHRRGDYRAYYDAELPPHAGRLGRNREMYSLHAPGLPRDRPALRSAAIRGS